MVRSTFRDSSAFCSEFGVSECIIIFKSDKSGKYATFFFSTMNESDFYFLWIMWRKLLSYLSSEVCKMLLGASYSNTEPIFLVCLQHNTIIYSQHKYLHRFQKLGWNGLLWSSGKYLFSSISNIFNLIFLKLGYIIISWKCDIYQNETTLRHTVAHYESRDCIMDETVMKTSFKKTKTLAKFWHRRQVHVMLSCVQRGL